MKIISFILLILIFFPNQVFNQNQDWEIQIGQFNQDEYNEDIIEYYDYGYYILGIEEFNDDFKGWNIKTSINGSPLWDKTILHDSFSLKGKSVAQDSEGNTYVAGVKFHEGTWTFIAKFNPCGEKVWCKILEDNELNSGNALDVIVNENGEVIILEYGDDEQAIEQIFLECLSIDGEILWKQSYASRDDHPWIFEPFGFDLMELNNEYYISGYCYYPYPSDTTHFYLRPLFIGIDSFFNEKWVLPFYALDSVFGDAYYSIPLNDTTLLGVGIRRTFGLEANSLIMLYSTNGENIGFSQIHNEQIGNGLVSNYIREVEKINDSVFYAAGIYEPVYGSFYNADYKTDVSAKLYNFKLKPNVMGIPDLVKTSDNKFIVASTIDNPNNDKNIYLTKFDENFESVPFDTTQHVYDSLCPDPIPSGIIDLSDCWIWTGVEEIPTPAQYYARIKTIPITVYPNPATDRVHFKLENTEHNKNIQLKCFNLLGKEVYHTSVIPGQKEASADVSFWQQGMYMVVVYSESKVVGKAKMVVGK